MSVTREDIKTTLDSIDGVRGFTYRPKTPVAGDSWPLRQTLNRGPALDFLATWKVVVVLSTEENAAMAWFDDNYQTIAETLEPVGPVQTIEPGTIQTDAGERFCMIITLGNEG